MTGVEMCPITSGEMPQRPKLRSWALLKVVFGLLGVLGLASGVGEVGLFAPRHAAAAEHVLVRSDAAKLGLFSSLAGELAGGIQAEVKPGALARSSAATEPEATVSSTPVEAQHPETPVEAEAPEPGMGSIEAGDDLNDFDDFAYHLRVVFDGTAQLNREVERGVSLGARAISRLEDNRRARPPRG